MEKWGGCVYSNVHEGEKEENNAKPINLNHIVDKKATGPLTCKLN